MASNAPNYVQGNYTVAQRDAIFAKADKYPDATLGLQNQVPTLAADGSIIWRNQSSGGGDGTANANIATVEDTSTASRAYAVGDLLVYSGNLYRVTAAIEELDTIVPGTNVTATTVAAAKQDATSYSSGDIDSYLAMVAAANAASGGNGLQGNIGLYEDSVYPGCFYRLLTGNVKEWLNPPMVLDTEYQTAERFQGKPVYALATTVDVAADYSSWGSTLYPQLNGGYIAPDTIVGAEVFYTVNGAKVIVPNVERGATMSSESNGASFNVSTAGYINLRVGFGSHAKYTLAGATLTVYLKYTKPTI